MNEPSFDGVGQAMLDEMERRGLGDSQVKDVLVLLTSPVTLGQLLDVKFQMLDFMAGVFEIVSPMLKDGDSRKKELGDTITYAMNRQFADLLDGLRALPEPRDAKDGA